MDNSTLLDIILSFLDGDKEKIKIFKDNIKVNDIKRAESVLDDLVRKYNKKANILIYKMNNNNNTILDDQDIYDKTYLSLHRYRDFYSKVNNITGFAMEYSITSNNTNTDTKELLFKTIIPEIINDYNKTKISEKIKIKSGSFVNCTIILYED